jgi:hypothetical protein
MNAEKVLLACKELQPIVMTRHEVGRVIDGHHIETT